MVASLVAIALQDSTRLSRPRGKNVTPGKAKAESSIRIAALWVIDVISAIPVWRRASFNGVGRFIAGDRHGSERAIPYGAGIASGSLDLSKRPDELSGGTGTRVADRASSVE